VLNTAQFYGFLSKHSKEMFILLFL